MGAIDEIGRPVLLFDGVCNLCNDAVNFILDHESSDELHFAPLQGTYAQQLLIDAEMDSPPMDSIILVERKRVYQKSSAILRTASYLKQPYSILFYAIYLPAFLRDPLYDLIARNRYRWFGKQKQCRISTPDLKERFIDSPILS